MFIRSFTILFLASLYSLYLAASPSNVFSQGSEPRNQNSKICYNMEQYIDENKDSEVEGDWKKWSSLEKWTWKQICKGKPADINEDYKKKNLDPPKRGEWTKKDQFQRKLSSTFIETILLKKPWCEIIPHNGVHIIGAWFGEDGLNLENAELKHQLRLENSQFDGVINFKRLSSPLGISLKKSFFSSQFNISWANIRGPLEMDNVIFSRKVKKRARAKGVWVQETPIEKKEADWVFMRGLKVDSDIIMNDGHFFPVDLQLAKIGGRLNLGNSTFMQSSCHESAKPPYDRPYCEDSFLMAGSQIDGEINMNQAKFLGNVSLRGAEVGNIVSMRNATFEKELYMEGVRIKGDLVMEGGNFQKLVAMKGAEVDGDFLMSGVSGEEKKDKSATFAGDVEMYRIRVRDQLVVKGAMFSGKLSMLGAIVGSNLDFRDSSFDKEVNLNSAKLERNFYLARAKFKDKLGLVGITVSGTLSFLASRFPDLRESNFDFDKEVKLNSANIGQDLILKKAKFQNEVGMNEISVGSNLDLANSTFDKKVNLKVAKIGQDVSLKKANFKGGIDMTGIDVTGSLIFDDGQFSEPVILSMSKSGDITYKGTELKSLDLTGTHVGKVIVESVSVANSPIELKLQDFTYNQFIYKENKKTDQNNINQEIVWQEWLNRMKKYTPQPYEQAAKVLRESGQPDLANKMLILGKDRERDEALKEKKMGRYRWLSLQKGIIGYGIGFGYINTIFWIIPLWIIGTIICFTTRNYAEMCKLLVNNTQLGEEQKCGSDNAKDEILSPKVNNGGQQKGNDEKHNSNTCEEANKQEILNAKEKLNLFDSAAFSFDMMLPLINLWGRHYNIDMPGWQRYYFYFHKMAGWFLFTFIAAGLAGLIQK